jgi:N4-(beta-N-acetylglucosaminyl)-L-asparaginase
VKEAVMSVSRRDFLATAAMTSIALSAEAQQAAGGAQQTSSGAQQANAPAGAGFGKGKIPILVASSNGMNGADMGYEMLRRGHDTLDTAIAVGKVQEDDPNDTSVGLGGLPNEDGVTELDSCCMHGPTRRAGSVGGVRNIKNVALLAQAVMQHTGHVMLVGEGAEKFAVAMGFQRESLLTERSRQTWMLWKEFHSEQDWWGPGISDPGWKPPVEGSSPRPASLMERQMRRLEELAEQLRIPAEYRAEAIDAVLHPPHGTIHCSALNEKGEISGMTTTSGLAWKLAGRCGDTPIIGAGCYTDQDVGSAGATGSGEENIKVAGAHTMVENMRKGMEPRDAGLDALKRIVRNYNGEMAKLRYVDMRYYLLRKDGAYAGVSLWSGRAGRPATFCVNDGTKRLEPCVALYQGEPLAYPPRSERMEEQIRSRRQQPGQSR